LNTVFLLAIHLLAFAQTSVASASRLLPQPSGAYSIGRQRFEWTDTTRHNPDGTARRLVVFVLYPAADTQAATSEYFPGATELTIGADTSNLEQTFGGAWRLIRSGQVYSNAIDGAPILKSSAKLPVLLFSPGLDVPTEAYSAQLEDLASHGYFVAAIEHPFDTPLLSFADGKKIAFDAATWQKHQPPGPPTLEGLRFEKERQDDWQADSVFALDKIADLSRSSGDSVFKRIDLRKIGAFGHSFGGVIAARLCQTEARVMACVNEDGEMFGQTLIPGQVVPSLDPNKEITKPLAVITVLEPEMKGVPEFQRLREATRASLSEYLRTRTLHSYLVKIDRPNIQHMSFSDIPLLNDAKGGIANRSNLELVRRAVLSFFEEDLAHNSSGSFGKVFGESPDISLQEFRKTEPN
jgi:dienelactone hydrolase